MEIPPWIRLCTFLTSYFADLVDLAHYQDPTAPFQSGTPPSSVPDLLGSSFTSTIAEPNSQAEVIDWEDTGNYGRPYS